MTQSELPRRLCLLLCSVSLAVCQLSYPSAPPPSVSGVVVNADDSQPIEGAIVTVVPDLPGQPRSDVAGARTGQDGRFNVLTSPATQYRVHCQKPGFVTLSRVVALAGNGATGGGNVGAPVELRMVAQAVITGQITDSTGKPLINANVRLSHVYLEGRRAVLSVAAQASTNDLGQYRIFGVEPGRYYVSASYQDAGGPLGLRQRPAADSASQVTTEDYAVVYYPAAREPETATPVLLRGGKVTSNIDLSIGMAQSFPVSGTVSGVPVDSPAPRVFLQPSDSASLGAVRTYLPHPGDARFRFASVPPGNYVLRAETNMRGQAYIAREEVSVSSATENIVLELQAPFTVAGVVLGEGGVQLPADLKLTLRGTDKHLQTTLKTDDYGRFQVPGAGPSEYTVTATDGGGKIFVKSVYIDDLPSPTGWVNIMGPNHNLKLVVSDRAGRIDGTAVDSNQRPAGRGLAVLVGASPQDTQTYAVSLDSGGKFRFQSLPPGGYRILCFSDLLGSEDATWDVQRKVKSDGKDISISESDDQQVTVEITRLDPL